MSALNILQQSVVDGSLEVSGTREGTDHSALMLFENNNYEMLRHVI